MNIYENGMSNSPFRSPDIYMCVCVSSEKISLWKLHSLPLKRMLMDLIK